MTTTVGLTATQAVRRAAVRATLAPSVHNTQPWRLELMGDRVELYLDPTRQLAVLDPLGRQARISCGCALLNARVALAARGYRVEVDRLPDPSRPQLLARLWVSDRGELDPVLAGLDRVIELRHTNRRRFSAEKVAASVVDRLSAAAAAEAATLQPIADRDRLVAVAELSQRANAVQEADPAYRVELRAWTTDEPNRRDGVSANVVPARAPISLDELPLRDFDTTGRGQLPAEVQSNLDQCLLLLATGADHPLAWVRAGEALQRALLTLTEAGYVAGILSQLAEIPAIRAELQAELDTAGYPHLLVRVGRAAGTAATRRRRLADVLVERA